MGLEVLGHDLDHDLDDVPGTVSVWCGRPGAPAAYTRLPDTTHYSASTMKLAVLAALHRRADGEGASLDLRAEIPVHNDFASAAPGAARFGCERRYDADPVVWRRLGGTATLGWLATRMIRYSSNLAANLVLERVGMPAASDAWRRAGGRHSVVRRGIEDAAAAAAGITNLVTAHDLALLLGAVAVGAGEAAEGPGSTEPDGLASRRACRRMLAVLRGQRRREDLAAGLPPGTRVAHKNGWIRGIRHAAGVVFPDDAPPFVLAVCTTTPWAVNQPDDKACRLVRSLAAAAWDARHDLAEATG